MLAVRTDEALAAVGANASSACHVAASVVPLTGMPRWAWKLRRAVSVAASKLPLVGVVGSDVLRCCCIQSVSSPLLPSFSSGQSWLGCVPSVSGCGGAPIACHPRSVDACQLHHD